MKFSSHKKFRQCLNNQHIQFSVSKDKYYRIQFSVRYKTELEKSHYCQHGRVASDQTIVSSNDSFVAFVLFWKYLHKIVSKSFWTPCDVHFEKQTSVFGLGLDLAFRIKVLCQCLRLVFRASVQGQGSVLVSKVRVYQRLVLMVRVCG